MVPFISEVVQGEGVQMQTEHIAQFELLILKLLDWRLHSTTHLHFLDWYKRAGVIAAGDAIDALPVVEKARVKLMKYIYFFADMLLLDSDFCEYSKTLSSAAIIATARLTQHIEPIWHLPDQQMIEHCDPLRFYNPPLKRPSSSSISCSYQATHLSPSLIILY